MDGRFTGFGTASLVPPSGAARVRPCSGVSPASDGCPQGVVACALPSGRLATCLRSGQQRHRAAHPGRLRATCQAAGRGAGAIRHRPACPSLRLSPIGAQHPAGQLLVVCPARRQLGAEGTQEGRNGRAGLGGLVEDACSPTEQASQTGVLTQEQDSPSLVDTRERPQSPLRGAVTAARLLTWLTAPPPPRPPRPTGQDSQWRRCL
jgi:hypothetical protein